MTSGPGRGEDLLEGDVGDGVLDEGMDSTFWPCVARGRGLRLGDDLLLLGGVIMSKPQSIMRALAGAEVGVGLFIREDPAVLGDDLVAVEVGMTLQPQSWPSVNCDVALVDERDGAALF